MKDIHQYLQLPDYLVVFFYLLIVVGIGVWVSFFRKKNESENLFLAGNSLPWYSIGLTMWGTNVGPSMLVASAASGFTYGIAGANFSWYAFLFIMILAMVFTPYYRVTKVSTLPEFIGKRFNATSRQALAWYSMISILISWLGITLYSGGILVSQIMGWSLLASIIVLLAISAFFTIAGGLEAIAMTNNFQMILLIVVSGILTIAGINAVGGVGEMFAKVPDNYWNLLLPSDHEAYPWLAIALGYPVLGIWFWCTDQSMVQSVLGAKSLKQAQIGTNLTGWLKIIDMPLFILPGVLCFILYPTIAAPEEAYATMVVNLLPTGMIGMVMAVLIAALVSTIDSALNSFSTIFTLDIYVKKFRPNATSKETVTIGRASAFGGGIIGVGIAMGLASLEGSDLFMLFQSILGYIAPPMAAVFVVGVLWKKATPLSANVVLLFGSAVSLGIGVCSLLGFPGDGFWAHPLLLSFYIFIGLVVLMIVVSLANPAESKVELPSLSEVQNTGEKNEKIVWVLWGLLCAVMVGLYLFFN